MPKPKSIARYECVGGPRDGHEVVIRRGARSVQLDGETYFVRWYVKRDERGLRLWEKECLVWDGHPAETADAEPQLEPLALGREPRILAAQPGRLILEDAHGTWWLVRERNGALAFVTHDELRRVEPAPRGWERLDALTLDALRQGAAGRA